MKQIINRMELRFPSGSVNESFARGAVSAFVLCLDPLVTDLNDLKTAVSEAVTNAIVHGYRDTIGTVYITAVIYADGTVQVKVRDRGCGIPDIEKAMEPLFTTGGEERAGLGFAVMQSFCDSVRVISKPQKGTTVTLTKRFERKPNGENKDFAERNVGLVRALVPRFLGRGIEYDDLFQAGCEGLIKAAAHFDPDRGYKFSTYAVPVILGEMRRLFREGGTVKVSRGLKELSMKAVRLSEQIETETGKAPSVSVLAEKLGVPEEKCAEALNAAAQPVSLTGDDENNETDIPVDAPEEKITDHLALQQILKALPEEDQRLIYYRYFKNQTQTETAKRLGTTQVQISRREKKLLLRLRGLLL